MLEEITSFREEELLASSIAGLIGDARHVAVGASSPIPAAAAMLARERGGGRPYVSLLGSRRQNFFTDGGRELFDCAGQGRIDAFFLSGAQIDGEANINLVSIGDYAHPKARFPGSFGSAYLYYVVPKVILFRLEHTRRTLVEKVDFISAPGASADNVHRPGGPVRPHHQSLPVRVRPRGDGASRSRACIPGIPSPRSSRTPASPSIGARTCRRRPLRRARICASCERRWRRSWSRSIPSSPPMCSGCDKLPDTWPASPPALVSSPRQRDPRTPCPGRVARGCHIG